MEFKDRINKDVAPIAEEQEFDAREFARSVFGDLAECFVVVGYSKGSGDKFAYKIAHDQLAEDSLEHLREAVVGWYNLGSNPNDDHDEG